MKTIFIILTHSTPHYVNTIFNKYG